MSVIQQLAVLSIEPPPFNIERRIDQLRDQKPAEVSSNRGSVLEDRRKFLQESLGSAVEDTFERIINGNELQPITYLARGAIAAKSVARIELHSAFGKLEGYGTGFLIAPRVLITNNHVLPALTSAASALAEFSFEVDLDDAPIGPVTFRTDPKELFFTSPELDFTVVAIRDSADGSNVGLDDFGCLPLVEQVGKVADAEWLTVVQHPEGGRKQLCVRDNQLIKRGDNVLWYATDTQPGSSGSPVFNNDWYVVALHHKGIPAEKNGKTQTVDGVDFDPATMNENRIKWIANEGVRVSRIIQALKAALPDHPLLKPLFAATAASARIGEPKRSKPPPVTPSKESDIVSNDRNPGFPIEVNLKIFSDGRVVTGNDGSTTESSVVFDEARKSKPTANFDAPFEDDYSKRKGFQTDFLGAGGKSVGFPVMTDALAAEVAPLIKAVGANKQILHYHNYSVVMHARRRFAIYSAANISFADRYDMSRPPDKWRSDPRILPQYQIGNWYYAANQFDRGHLTRREDLEYGKSRVQALQSAADTCHFTNCTPQHSQFNQNKEIWQGIERHLLEETIEIDNVNAQVFTGPVLDEGDPEYRKIQYPMQFWKVVAALNSDGELFATAYIASQQDVIAKFGIEVTEPFGPYKTFQTSVREIEGLTGLKFVCGVNGKKALSDCDPLSKPSARRRRRSRPAEESMGGLSQPAGYYEITSLDDIQLEA